MCSMLMRFPAVGYLFIAIMSTTSILLIDLCPTQGSSITACVSVHHFPALHLLPNACLRLPVPIIRVLTVRTYVQNDIVRYFLGVAFISVINIILDVLKPGWTHVLLAGMCIALCPLLYVQMKWGPVWRENRRRRMAFREFQPTSQ